jgi:hypothetical protein
MKVDESMATMFKDQFADLPPEYKKEVPPLDEIYLKDPSPECPAGTRGRVAVFEMFDMNVELEHAILAGKPEDDMFAIVRKHGMFTMKEDAIMKAAKGSIPFEEVNTLGGQFELPEEEADYTASKAPEVLGADVKEEDTKEEVIAKTSAQEIQA